MATNSISAMPRRAAKATTRIGIWKRALVGKDVKYQLTRMWAVEPYYIYWHVGASPVNYDTATFTVNGVTAHQLRGCYEPTNYTHEVGVRVGLHF